ncbi:MBG domain-containing protein [Cellulomonas soli]|uniref:receptor protein-tyrosine kinase n=1 Tax=Cellulomonas soli TaxID=931535 RepID=A0A512P8J8_9CELL|nr:MBG domain-containing protein [Cellulomonas soli]NYI57743.1 hypothetical protein [Cellulomonas soli]GEP67524.1 hypothetical protein CSO01_02390 [Cellulomonas soli]
MRRSARNALVSAASLGLLAPTLLWATPVASALESETTTFTTTGVASYTVPAGVSVLTIEAWGAEGTKGPRESNPSPGKGGGIRSTVTVTPGQVLQVMVGAAGGGGVGGVAWASGGNGGGASGVRAGSCAAALACDPSADLVIAGGGGGAGPVSNLTTYDGPCGGDGGANPDGSGARGCSSDSTDPTAGGAGGTATAGGAGGTKLHFDGAPGTAGHGGDGEDLSGGGGGGGGDGHYGGGAGVSSRADTPTDGGGGGGSSWAVPAAISTEFLGASRTGDGSVTITTLAGVAVSSTTVTASANPIRAGDEVKYVATVSPGDVGGTLTFTADGTDIPSCIDMAVSNGIAECWNSRVLRTTGTHTISARYSGSDGALPSTAPGLVMTVQPATTSTTLEADEVSVGAGTPVTYTATVTPPPVGGTVRFRSTGQAISGCDAVVPDPTTGVAVCTFVYRTTGGWLVYADFSGTSSYSASSSSEVSQAVNPTQTTTVVTSGGNPSGIDQTVTYTASVSPAPTSGTVAFTHDGAAVAGCAAVAVNASGQASCTRTYAIGGSHTVSATFAGIPDYAASTSDAFTQTVSASIALSSDTGSAPLGFGVRLTATLSPAPAGSTVTFFDGGSPVTGCTRLPVDSGSGRATCLTGFTTTGAHPIAVDHYNAGGTLLGRSGAFSQDVTLATADYTTTGADSAFVVPATWSDIRIEAWAAAGARAHREDTTSPGQGGRVVATVAVTPGQVLQVSVGAVGGGGAGGTGEVPFGPAGNGGGASGVRFGPCAATLSCDVGSTLVVAGGGGGSGSWNGSFVGENSWIPCGGNGGIGSDGSGGSGCSTDSNTATGGAGATATAGGAGGTKTEFQGFTGSTGTAGHGGAGAVASPTSMGGGGGGDGWFGGGGGAGGAAYSQSRGGGGGGSSWVSPTVTSSAFLGSPSTGAGSVTITHAATRILLTSTSEGNLPFGVERTLTARLVDSGGATVDSGPDSVLPVTFSRAAGAGSVTGLTTVSAVAGVATIQVTGADLGALDVAASAGGFTSAPWSLLVARVAQVVTFDAPPSPAAYGTGFLVAPTVDSGLAPSLQASGGCTSEVTTGGWTVTMTSGTVACTLVASQAGDAQREPAPSVTRVVSAAKQAQAPLALAATSTGTYGEAYPVVGSGGSGTGSLSLDLTGAACTLTDNAASSAVLTAVGVGTCTTTLTRAGDANYDAAQSTRVTEIGARPLTVTANAATKVYGTADPAVTATLSGFAFAETTADAGVSGVADCARAAGEDVASYVITCAAGTLTADHYSLVAGPTAAFTITPADLTITASSEVLVYGEPVSSVAPRYTGLANGDLEPSTRPACSTTAMTLSSVDTYPTACTGAGDPNYSITELPGTVTVTPAPLLVTASDGTSVYGDPAPVIQPRYTGLLGADDASTALSVAPTCASLTDRRSVVGTYASTCSSAVSHNYALTYADGVVEVTRADLVVTAADATAVYGDGPPAVHPLYAGLVNGEVDVDDGPVCRSSSTPTTGAGTYVGAATCADAVDPNYTIRYLPGDVTVTAARLLITASDGTAAYGAAAPVTTPSYVGLVNGETAADALSTVPSCTPGTSDRSPVGRYASSCAAAVGANYAISYAAGAVVITRAPLVVTVGDASRLVGQPDPAFGYTVAGLVDGDTVAALTGSPSYSTPATPTSAVGTYPVKVSGLAAANYAIAFQPGSLTITRAPVEPSPRASSAPDAATATVERDQDAGGEGALGTSGGTDAGSASEATPPAVESDAPAPAANGGGDRTAASSGASATGAPWPLVLAGLALLVVAAGAATAAVRRHRG